MRLPRRRRSYMEHVKRVCSPQLYKHNMPAGGGFLNDPSNDAQRQDERSREIDTHTSYWPAPKLYKLVTVVR